MRENIVNLHYIGANTAEPYVLNLAYFVALAKSASGRLYLDTTRGNFDIDCEEPQSKLVEWQEIINEAATGR